MVRFYFPDPEAPWSSEGYLGPNGVETDSMKFAGQSLRSHYQNDATPKTVLEPTQIDSPKFDDIDMSRLASLWQQKYHNRLGTETGTPGVVLLGYKLVQMLLQSGADIRPLLEFWSDEQLMNFGVPKSVLGKVVSGDRSSAETNQYVFDRYTVLPIATLISQGITYQLAPDFDSSIFCEFEPFVSDDKKFQLEQETADLNGKVRSINMIHQDRGTDPVEWGDDPVGKLGEVPYDPGGGFDLEPDEPDALGDLELTDDDSGGEEEARARRAGSALRSHSVPVGSKGRGSFRARASFFSPKAEWLRQVHTELRFTPSFQRALAIIFRQQKKDVLAKFKAQMPRARITVDQLFTPAEWREKFEMNVEPVRVAAFESVMKSTLEGFGIDEFIFNDAVKAQIERQGGAMITHVNRTTKRRLDAAIKRIQAELIEGADTGQGIESIARSIRKVFNVRQHEARTIARTEIGRASTVAQLESFAIAGVESQTWHTSMDDAVRDAHIPMENVTALKGEPFLVDGEQLAGPREGFGGAQASAGNVINCRCFLTPDILEG